MSISATILAALGYSDVLSEAQSDQKLADIKTVLAALKAPQYVSPQGPPSGSNLPPAGPVNPAQLTAFTAGLVAFGVAMSNGDIAGVKAATDQMNAVWNVWPCPPDIEILKHGPLATLISDPHLADPAAVQATIDKVTADSTAGQSNIMTSWLKVVKGLRVGQCVQVLPGDTYPVGVPTPPIVFDDGVTGYMQKEAFSYMFASSFLYQRMK
jgi:hypothetical protein